MAEGGSDSPCDETESDETDATTNLHFERRRIQRQVSTHDVEEQATVLLQHFIVDRFQQDGFDNAPGLDDLRAGLPVPRQREVIYNEVGLVIRSIGDTLDRDPEFQRKIDSLLNNGRIEINAFMRVAKVVFGDGKTSWGRIVGLFYFAYRMCARAINIMGNSLPSWINKLIKEVVKFLVIQCATWIINKGGWMAIREYVDLTVGVWWTLFTLSSFCVVLSVYKLSR